MTPSFVTSFAGKHVVVTGGTGALGRAVVEAFLEAGAFCHVPHRGAVPADMPRSERLRLTAGVELSDEAHVMRYYAELPGPVGVDPHGGRLRGGARARHDAGRAARAARAEPGERLPLQPRGRAAPGRRGGPHRQRRRARRVEVEAASWSRTRSRRRAWSRSRARSPPRSPPRGRARQRHRAVDDGHARQSQGDGQRARGRRALGQARRRRGDDPRLASPENHLTTGAAISLG